MPSKCWGCVRLQQGLAPILTAFTAYEGGRGLPRRAVQSWHSLFQKSHGHVFTTGEWVPKTLGSAWGPAQDKVKRSQLLWESNNFSHVKLGNWGLVFLSSSFRGQASPGCVCLLLSRISALPSLSKYLKLGEVWAGAFSL